MDDAWVLVVSCVFLIAAFTGFHDNSVSSLSAKFGEKLESRYETSFYSTKTRYYFIIFLLSYIFALTHLTESDSRGFVELLVYRI